MSFDINLYVYSEKKADEKWDKIKKGNKSLFSFDGDEEIKWAVMLKRNEIIDHKLNSFYLKLIEQFNKKGYKMTPEKYFKPDPFEEIVGRDDLIEIIKGLFTNGLLVDTNGKPLQLSERIRNSIKEKYLSVMKEVEIAEEKVKKEMGSKKILPDLYDLTTSDIEFGALLDELVDPDINSAQCFGVIYLPIHFDDASAKPEDLRKEMVKLIDSLDDKKFEKIANQLYKHNNIAYKHFQDIDDARNILEDYRSLIKKVVDELKKDDDFVLVVKIQGEIFTKINQKMFNDRAKKHQLFFK